ncbi:MAG: CapA family protein, partial [Clostridia bacterium]|nr:CapA family protein [Clostridia bacterium]
FTRGLMAQTEMLETVVPFWETDENKNLKSLKLMPIKISCGEGKHLEGLPQPTRDLGFMERLAEMSRPYGVEITMEDGIAVCRW